MQIVSTGDILHKMSKPVSGKKIVMLAAENFSQGGEH